MDITCSNCNGSGTFGQDTCSICDGDGILIFAGEGMSEINPSPFRSTVAIVLSLLLTNTTMPTNVFNSYIILEELDATEHAALTDTQKDGILHILACGRVDLNDGKAGKTRLWNWVGAESTTVANLTALLT